MQLLKQTNSLITNLSYSKMKFLLCILSVLLATCMLSQSTIAFTTSHSAIAPSKASTVSSTTKLHFFGQKDDGSPGDYKCLDCDYVFTKGPKAWSELPDNWSCPTCGSVKRRFKKIPKGSASSSGGAKTETKKKGMFGF
mmetsp:Transcript_27504/g.45479  ORF Transcript_27504/g.45479 Transcript_27504/m.45479 type:complete len:139 (+) Transcript_27504:329-745(+)